MLGKYLSNLKEIAIGNISVINTTDLKNLVKKDFSNSPEIAISLNIISKNFTNYKKGEISLEKLIDWVNLVWFNDIFVYNHTEEDKISEVLYLLEQLDEPDKKDSITMKVEKMLSSYGSAKYT